MSSWDRGHQPDISSPQLVTHLLSSLPGRWITLGRHPKWHSQKAHLPRVWTAGNPSCAPNHTLQATPKYHEPPWAWPFPMLEPTPSLRHSLLLVGTPAWQMEMTWDGTGPTRGQRPSPTHWPPSSPDPVSMEGMVTHAGHNGVDEQGNQRKWMSMRLLIEGTAQGRR